jgi:two-component system chemotaxis sensor kinase CheA
MSDQSFFEELQNDFLNEVAFLLETYEEHMLGLENGVDKAGHLTQIFRVAHSIKGGAAAVGFQDFSHFAHIVEDLLSILRAAPEFVTSEIISILLLSGDQFKNRVKMLQEKDNSAWDVSELEKRIEHAIKGLTGKSNAELNTPPAKTAKDIIPLDEEAPSVSTVEAVSNTVASAAPAEVDHTNYDLLNELMAELPEEVINEYHKTEAEPTNVISAENAKSEPAKVVKQEVAVNNVTPITAAKKITEPEKNDSQSKDNSDANKKTGHKAHVNQIIKVDTARVDNVLDAVGELVVLKNQIVHNEFIKNGNNPQLAAIVDQLDKGVRELYDKTLSIRMTPLKSLYIKIQRIVRDVSITLDKPVNLELIGEETEVERTVFELLNDPLVHLVRNAMDHGVENKETRKQKNKPEVANVTVSSKQMGGNVIIDIIDDGGGINRDRVLQKVIEKKLISETTNPDNLSDEDVFKFIFAPGFSTAEKISDLSGRGVGLDVVRSNIEKVNGKINIYSKPGLGSTFRLTIPLSTAITDGIVVLINKQRFIMPIYAIKEIIRLKKEFFTEVPGQGHVAKVRDYLLPVVNLSSLFEDLRELMDVVSEVDSHEVINKQKRTDELMLVIVESGGKNMAIPVDDVIGQTQVVVKSLSIGANVPEVSGAAILGDGKTVLILDPNAIVKDLKYEVAV